MIDDSSVDEPEPTSFSPTLFAGQKKIAENDGATKNFYKLADFDCSNNSPPTFSDCEVTIGTVGLSSAVCANRSRRANSDYNIHDINKRNSEHNEHEVCTSIRASTICDRIAQMFLNEHLADIVFEVGADDASTERVTAHKFVLAIGSTVFNAMFRYDRLNGIDSNPSNEIQAVRVVDVEPSAFVALLRFLYTDETPLADDTVMAILYAAKKYDVPALERRCLDHLRQRLSAENAFVLLAQSRFFDEPAFGTACLDAIDRDTPEALLSDGFLEIDQGTLCTVLRRDELRVNELPLFHAVVKWADEECRRRVIAPLPENRRMALGEAVRLVRYTQMTMLEFGQHVAPSGVLTAEELVDVFLYFALAGGAPARPFWPIASRWRFVGRRLVINRFQRVESSWGYSGTSDRIKFQTDNGIWLLGIGLYGSVGEPADYEVVIEVIREDGGRTLAHRDTRFSADGTPSIFPVLFAEPVEIAANITYIIAAKLTGPESHYGAKGLRRIVRQVTGGRPPPAPAVVEAPTTTINSKNMTQNVGHVTNCDCNTITFYFSFAHGNNNGTSVDDGQIPQLIFSERL